MGGMAIWGAQVGGAPGKASPFFDLRGGGTSQGMNRDDNIYVRPEEDVGLDDYIPSASPIEADHSPRWLRVLVGDGGVQGQQVWVRFFADDAPRDLPAFKTEAPRPGVPDAWIVSPVSAQDAKPSQAPSPPLEALSTTHANAMGWMTVEQAAPKLDLTKAALQKRLYRAARKTKDGVRANLDGVEARKLGETWKVYIPADWRRS
jgi:hypothetical protein